MPRDTSVPDPAARDKYRLQVTAGPSYDASTHVEVNVNGEESCVIENDVMKCWLRVRIREYNGLPFSSPSSHSYFSHPLHLSDRYSIGFSFVPKTPINGSDLVAGFDFDHSIRDRLPPGFKTAMRIVTTLLDPGVYSDPYSDKPYLYGPGLSSFFAFRIGEMEERLRGNRGRNGHEEGIGNGKGNVDATISSGDDGYHEFGPDKSVIEEGAEGSGQHIRTSMKLPSRVSKRRKHFLNPKNLSAFRFEPGRIYHADFFNPYLDFANFALRIPGFSISVVRYIDDKTHQLRFVMKNRATGDVLFVVVFTLLFGESLREELEKRDVAGKLEMENGHSRCENWEEVPGTADGSAETKSSERPVSVSTSIETKTSAPSAPDSDVAPEIEENPRKEDVEHVDGKAVEPPRTPEENTSPSGDGALGGLVHALYDSLTAIGFGRKPGGSAASSVESSPERGVGRDTERERRLESEVERMDRVSVERFLKERSSSGGGV